MMVYRFPAENEHTAHTITLSRKRKMEELSKLIGEISKRTRALEEKNQRATDADESGKYTITISIKNGLLRVD